MWFMVFTYGMDETVVSIDKAGRVVLPKEVREDLAISGGDLLDLTVRGREVTLRPRQKKSGLQRKGKALVFCSQTAEGLSDEETRRVLDEVRSEREEKAVKGLQKRATSK